MKLETKAGGIGIRVNKKGRVSGEGRYLVGYASVFGVRDFDEDITERGTFARSLEVRPEVKVLRMHNWERPIGITTMLQENETGLLFKAKISDTVDGAEMLELVQDGVIAQMSIGFRGAIRENIRVGGQSANRLLQVDLWEISPVLFGSNPQTSVELSKAGRRAIVDAVLVAEYELWEKKGQLMNDWTTRLYLQAAKRQIERSLYGRTEKQLTYDLLYTIQKELAALRDIYDE